MREGIAVDLRGSDAGHRFGLSDYVVGQQGVGAEVRDDAVGRALASRRPADEALG
ncbi:MAG: hypothetical protein GY946_08730 [bacterium]|nr:hypothetical protein [bacterium]